MTIPFSFSLVFSTNDIDIKRIPYNYYWLISDMSVGCGADERTRTFTP